MAVRKVAVIEGVDGWQAWIKYDPDIPGEYFAELREPTPGSWHPTKAYNGTMGVEANRNYQGSKQDAIDTGMAMLAELGKAEEKPEPAMQIDVTPDWSGMFNWAIRIASQLDGGKGGELVKEMLEYGKRLHELKGKAEEKPEPLTPADLHDIYQSYRHWIDDGQQEDWWAGHGYDGEFTFDINFVLGYASDDLENTNDFGVWLYPVDSSDPNFVPMAGIDVTDEFKAYLEKENKMATYDKAKTQELLDIVRQDVANLLKIITRVDKSSHHYFRVEELAQIRSAGGTMLMLDGLLGIPADKSQDQAFNLSNHKKWSV